MSDLAHLVKDLVDIAADSFQQRISENRLLSLLIARKFFERKVISIPELRELVEVHLQKTLTQQKLLELVQTPPLAKICVAKSTVKTNTVYIEPSPTLSNLIQSKYVLNNTQLSNTNVRVTNGTDIGTYGKSGAPIINNKEPSESERLAQMIEGEFTCMVCLDILNETVESSCCQTLCCRLCAEKLPTCPTCRALNIKWQANHPIRRIIGKRPVKCSHNGCNSWPTTAELKTHLSNCDHRLVACRYEGCAARMKQIEFQQHTMACKFSVKTCNVCRQLVKRDHRRDVQCTNLCGIGGLCEGTLSTHLAKTCSRRLVACTSKGCITKVPAHALSHHLKNCAYAVVPCTNNGCKVAMPRKDLPNHLQICPEAHMQCIHCRNIYRRVHIDQHQATCPQRPTYRCNACGIIYYQGESHAEACCERFINCTNDHCERKVKAKNLQHHIDNRCGYTTYRCINEPRCNKVLYRKDLQQHEEYVCPYRILQCDNCGAEYEARHANRHQCDTYSYSSYY